MGNTFIVELTYRVGKDECKTSKSAALNPNEALCCDLGIDNFAAFGFDQTRNQTVFGQRQNTEEHQSAVQQTSRRT